MLFKWQIKSHLIVIFLSQSLYCNTLHADKLPLKSAIETTTLKAKPQKCVTLNEGRTCFANVSFTWQTNLPEELCLIQKAPQKIIRCFKKSNLSSVKFEFESNKTMTYQLLNKQNNVLAETKIEVNWVYESSPRKRRWRVF